MTSNQGEFYVSGGDILSQRLEMEAIAKRADLEDRRQVLRALVQATQDRDHARNVVRLCTHKMDVVMHQMREMQALLSTLNAEVSREEIARMTAATKDLPSPDELVRRSPGFNPS